MIEASNVAFARFPSDAEQSQSSHNEGFSFHSGVMWLLLQSSGAPRLSVTAAQGACTPPA